MLNYNKLCDLGMDFFKDSSEWYPQITNTFGGLVTDIDGRTDVEGLFAAGTCRSFEPGVYIGGLAISITATMGKYAGKATVQYLEDISNLAEIESEDIQECKDRLETYIGCPTEYTPQVVLNRVREVIFPYDVSIIKNEESLQLALASIREIKMNLVPQMLADDPHTLLKAMEVTNIVTTSEPYLMASLERKETRAGHYREDYPEKDDSKGLSWLIFSKNDDNYLMEVEPLPIDTYKYPIHGYYSDCFDLKK